MYKTYIYVFSNDCNKKIQFVLVNFGATIDIYYISLISLEFSSKLTILMSTSIE